MHQRFPREIQTRVPTKRREMAAVADFKIEERGGESQRRGKAPTHPYNLRLRKCSGRVATPAKVARRSRVKRGVCGELKVSTTRRKRITIRPSAIGQKEYVIPPSSTDPGCSPTTVVIKTNPLFRATSPLSDNDSAAISPAARIGSAGATGTTGGEGGSHEAFYGQRRKIRRTKEHEMISAVLGLANHNTLEKKDKSKRKKTLLQKLRSIGSGLKGRRKGYPLASRDTNSELELMLTQT